MSRKQLLISLCLLACVACASVAYAQTAATRPARQDDGARAFSMILGGDNFLGVYTEQVTRENMSRYSLSGEPRGVAVTEVAENSPAAKAGLQKDDVILRFDGEAVGSTQKLSRLINESAPEHTARLTVSRGGSEREITVTLGKRELATTREGMMFNNGELFRLNQGEWQKQSAEEARKQAEEWQKHSEEWKKQTEQLRQQLEKMPRPENFSFVLGAGRRIGVTTTALTDQLADYFGVSHDGGVLITSVTENSPAAKAGLKAGDVITEADGAKIANAVELTHAIGRKEEGDVTLTVVRERNRRTFKVTPEKAQGGSTWTIPEGLFAAPAIATTIPRYSVVRPAIIGAPQLRALPASPAQPRVLLPTTPLRARPAVRALVPARGQLMEL
ncbi:MAG: serine protease Do [Acidobacteriota bacterium]|nr:serine protease Do [Acidobacteriota bacterium]